MPALPAPPVIYGQEVLYAARGQDARSRPGQARLQGCRAFGELSRTVVERRLEQAAEESSGSDNPFPQSGNDNKESS